MRLALVAALAMAASPVAATPTVLVLLFDGVAGEMVDAHETPSLDRMRREGAWTTQLAPVFPSISLVNGISVSTGCWPARHGIVSNEFLDPSRGRYDHATDADWLLDCDHLHEVAEAQGLRAAALGWYGARSTTRGSLASHVTPAKRWVDYPDDAGRAAQVVAMLARPPAQRPQLILAYFKGPDLTAHEYGVHHERTAAAMAAADEAVGTILAAVDALPDADDVTVLVTTDHGMRDVATVINVAGLLDDYDVPAQAVSSGTISLLYFEDAGAVPAARARLAEHGEFEVWTPEEAPAYARMGTGPRVGDLVVSAKPPYFIEDVHRWPFWARWWAAIGPRFIPAGLALRATHGYPPHTPGMAGVLFARGRGIARGRAVAAARAIDVHPTVTRLLGIAPGDPVDGEPLEAFLVASE